ncbi:MAG: hypothetical protein M1834_003943 [Cirrosporium novae-zelandiae]|nr:MAG: hypothetical protein M1834_003943 [Cirrosporium novae-zelandiae]
MSAVIFPAKASINVRGDDRRKLPIEVQVAADHIWRRRGMREGSWCAPQTLRSYVDCASTSLRKNSVGKTPLFDFNCGWAQEVLGDRIEAGRQR